MLCHASSSVIDNIKLAMRHLSIFILIFVLTSLLQSLRVSYFFSSLYIVMTSIRKEIQKQFQYAKMNKILMQRPEIQIHFIQSEKLRCYEQQEHRLKMEMLRVAAAEKASAIQSVFSMSQDDLCSFFQDYEISPDLDLHQLKESSKLKLIRNDGKVYFGQVAERKMSGMGVCFYAEGKIYEGCFIDNRRQGRGCQIHANGNFYIGSFLKGKKHGEGQFYWFNAGDDSSKPNSSEVYEGSWWGGLPDGKGIMRKSNGDVYQGTFKNGLKHGFGEERFGNGDQYKGQYANGVPEGMGQYRWKDGSHFRGDFKQGLRSGFGCWKAGRNERSERYEGQYFQDKKSGYGEYTWENGWSYRGSFQNDLRWGYGQLFNLNQCVFRGQWEKGQKVLPQSARERVKVSKFAQMNIFEPNEQFIEIQGINQALSNGRLDEASNFRQHKLLTRPGFLIHKTKPASTSRLKWSTNREDKREWVGTKIGTDIQRPVSRVLVRSWSKAKG